MSDTKIIIGSNGTGSTRKYKFNLTTARQGLTLMAEYSAIGVAALPKILDLLSKYGAENQEGTETSVLFKMLARDLHSGDGPVLACVRLIPQILTEARVAELCQILLAGAEIDDQKCDDEGMCDLFARRPHEIYVAIFWALMANYPDYLYPLLGALEAEGSDMTDTNAVAK